MSFQLILTILCSAVSASVPVLLAGMGGLFTHQANVFNNSLEGMLLVGASSAVAGSIMTGSWMMGILFGILGSLLVSLLFAFFVLKIRMGQFITGIAINTFAAGGTTYFMRQLFGVKGTLTSPDIVAIPKWDIPILRDIPILGDVLNGHPVPLYLTFFIIVPLVFVVLYKTQFGLRLRASGFEPKAADSVGIKSGRYQFVSILICGVLCGLGGSYLSIGYMRLFSENMSSGRGWIAIAIILLTNGHPLKILFLGLVFGFCEGLGLSLQSYNVPTQFTYMLPYLATLLALFLNSRKRLGQRKAGETEMMN